MTRILFVCTGNICRSPTAEAVARVHAGRHGVSWHVESAGTGRWSVGSPPDPRAIEVAARRGYALEDIRARQIEALDFSRFDHLVALDGLHLAELRRFPHGHVSGRISLLLDWSENERGQDVPDPYYGDEAEFEHALDLIEKGVGGLIDRLHPKG